MFIEANQHTLPELQIYASCNEVQLKRYYEPDFGLFIAETPNVILRALKAGYVPVSMLIDRRLKETDAAEVIGAAEEAYRSFRKAAGVCPEAKKASVGLQETGAGCSDTLPVYLADLDVISAISGFKQTRGVLCAMRRRKLPELQDILDGASRIAVLENVENPTNVGAVFRSAAALGIDAVVLTHRSADPLYRRAARVSMGTVFQVPWTFVGKKGQGLYGNGRQMIREAGFRTVAMTLSDRAVPIDDPALKAEEKLALLFGNEEDGLIKETVEESDYTVKIPMMNGVDSLNVAAAAAVAFWELRKR